MKTLACRDVGMDCDFVARAESNEELMRLAAHHAEETHHITKLSPEVVVQMQEKVRDESR